MRTAIKRGSIGGAAVEFRVLGPLEVWEGVRAVPLGGGRARALLVILLLSANRVVPANRLIDLLWGEEPSETARNSLQVHISQLRKVLERQSSKDSAYSVLLSQPTGYLLRVSDEMLALRRFEQLIDRGREAISAEQHQRAAELLSEALALWRGLYFAEFGEQPWAVREAERLQELRLRALEDRIQAELPLGQHADVIGELQAAHAEYPLRERLCGQLMLALYRSGRQAEASAVYQRIRERLAEELGMDPGADLQRLLDQILNQDPALDVQFRATVAPRRTNLPLQLASFVGRSAELSELSARMSQARLLTLTGAGGVGKTRLASELGRQALDSFPDGVWLIDLAALSDPELLPMTVAAQLKLQEQAGRTVTDTVAAYLQGRHALLLLDNCEHLLEASAAFAIAILTRCPGVRVLATSRQPLGVPGEQVWPLAPLAVPQPSTSLAEFPAFEALQLFLDRARLLQPSFAPNESNAPALVRSAVSLTGCHWVWS